MEAHNSPTSHSSLSLGPAAHPTCPIHHVADLKAVVQHIIIHMQEECEHWSRVQDALHRLQHEIDSLHSSLALSEDRALRSESELSSLKQMVREYRCQAEDAEEESATLRSEKKVLMLKLQRMARTHAMEKRAWLKMASNCDEACSSSSCNGIVTLMPPIQYDIEKKSMNRVVGREGNYLSSTNGGLKEVEYYPELDYAGGIISHNESFDNTIGSVVDGASSGCQSRGSNKKVRKSLDFSANSTTKFYKNVDIEMKSSIGGGPAFSGDRISPSLMLKSREPSTNDSVMVYRNRTRGRIKAASSEYHGAPKKRAGINVNKSSGSVNAFTRIEHGPEIRPKRAHRCPCKENVGNNCGNNISIQDRRSYRPFIKGESCISGIGDEDRCHSIGLASIDINTTSPIIPSAPTSTPSKIPLGRNDHFPTLSPLALY